MSKNVRFSGRVGVAALAAFAALSLIAGTLGSTAAHDPPEFAWQQPLTVGPGAAGGNYPNCRFGLGGNVNGYAVAALNVGWHLDWSAQISPTHPNGADYLQVIRLKPDLNSGYSFTPTTTTLHTIIDQNRGATWLIGNEPDSPWQDNLLPEDYARAYRHVYGLVKQRDPSARVGAGGIVQPTPLRFQYLDRVLTSYRQMYGERLPADLWNVHTYILREIDVSDPEADPNGPYEVWGAYIPPGISATRGILYTYSDMFSTAIFQQRLIDFRTWLRDRGYRDTPLYITEHGELFPYPPYIPPPPYQDEHGVHITEDRVAAYMTGTFDILLNLADAAVGYPADDHRLVQRWLWYSISDPNFGGLLFDPTTRERRPLGDVFYTYTHALSPGVDLLAVRVVAEPAAIPYAGQPETTTLNATIANIGNIAVTTPVTIAFYSGSPPTGTRIGSPRVFPAGLEGCAATTEISATWSNLDAGAHHMYVEVDPGNAIVEARDDNNVAAGFALVATHRFYLPTVTKDYSFGIP